MSDAFTASKNDAKCAQAIDQIILLFVKCLESGSDDSFKDLMQAARECDQISAGAFTHRTELGATLPDQLAALRAGEPDAWRQLYVQVYGDYDLISEETKIQASRLFGCNLLIKIRTLAAQRGIILDLEPS